MREPESDPPQRNQPPWFPCWRLPHLRAVRSETTICKHERVSADAGADSGPNRRVALQLSRCSQIPQALLARQIQRRFARPRPTRRAVSTIRPPAREPEAGDALGIPRRARPPWALRSRAEPRTVPRPKQFFGVLDRRSSRRQLWTTLDSDRYRKGWWHRPGRSAQSPGYAVRQNATRSYLSSRNQSKPCARRAGSLQHPYLQAETQRWYNGKSGLNVRGARSGCIDVKDSPLPVMHPHWRNVLLSRVSICQQL